MESPGRGCGFGSFPIRHPADYAIFRDAAAADCRPKHVSNDDESACRPDTLGHSLPSPLSAD
jgi:hypothetical protein